MAATTTTPTNPINQRPQSSVMTLGCKRRTLERHPEMKLLGGGDGDSNAKDNYLLESLVYRCSFTSLACTSAPDSTTCTFYWVDVTRGLLGRGIIQPPDPQEAAPVVKDKKTIRTTMSSHHNLPKVTSFTVPKLSGSTRHHNPTGPSKRKSASRCDMTLLLSGLDHPSRVAVPPGKDNINLVFYLEEGTPASSNGKLSVYNTTTNHHHALVEGLYCPKGLQVTEKLDVIFLLHPKTSTPGQALEVCCLPGVSMMTAIKHGAKLVPIVIMRFDDTELLGRRPRFQDVALLSNGQLLLGGRQATSTRTEDADMEGVVIAYEPLSGTLPDPKFPPAHPDTPVGYYGPRRGRLEKLVAKPPPPVPPPDEVQDEGAIPVTQTPADVRRRSSITRVAALPLSGQSVSRRGSTSGTGPAASKPGQAPNQGSPSRAATEKRNSKINIAISDKAGRRGGSGKLPPATVEKGTSGAKGRRSTVLVKEVVPPPQPVFVPLPPPVIPPLKMESVYDRLFGANTSQPTDTPGRVLQRQRRHWPEVTPCMYEDGDAQYQARRIWCREHLPIIRQLLVSPSTSRLLLACCGATWEGDVVSLGFLDRHRPNSYDSLFQPVLGGFCTCAAVDDFGNIILRSARGNGELLILWAKGSHGWGRLMTDKAARVPIPLTPKTSPTQENLPAAEATIVDGKVAEWSRALVSGAGWQQPEQHENLFTSSGPVNTIVVLRCRPLLEMEKEGGGKSVLSCTLNDVTVEGITTNKQSRVYHFDRVFNTEASQADVYNSVIAPVVHRVLEGYNCTVWAYGQTGSGKTFTMEGSMDDGERAGVIPRSVYNIFNQLKKLPGSTYRVYVSHVELYNEYLFDLLKSHRETEDKLRIEEGKDHRPRVRGARQIIVRSPYDIFRILQKSIKNRHTAETLCNRSSSRSHAIFSINVKCQYHHPLDGEVMFEGRLNLVDLSGSENIKRSGAEGVRAREAGNIGQSLLAFSRVITALVQSNPHVPYRDSNLTYLLSDSLGGKSYSTIILNVTPSNLVLDETLNTLKYASLARDISSTPEQTLRKKKNGDDSSSYDGDGNIPAGISLEKLHEPINPFQGCVPVRIRPACKSPARRPPSATSSSFSPSKPAAVLDPHYKTYHCEAQAWARDMILGEDGELQCRAIESLQTIFASLDRNKDGKLTWAEVNNMETLWSSKDMAPTTKTKALKKKRQQVVGRGYLTFEAFCSFATDVAKRDPLLLRTIFTKHGFNLGLTRAADEAHQSMLEELGMQEGSIAKKEGDKEEDDPVPMSSGFVSPKDIYKYLAHRESITQLVQAAAVPRAKSTGQTTITKQKQQLPERVMVRTPSPISKKRVKSPPLVYTTTIQDLSDEEVTLPDSLERCESTSGMLYTLNDFEAFLSPTIRSPLSSTSPKRPRSAPSFRGTVTRSWSPKGTQGPITKALSGSLFLEDTRYLSPVCDWCGKDKNPGTLHSIAFCGGKRED